jgi:uncharacterized sporulation protein YeaH/YhbH (DUF444 family)
MSSSSNTSDPKRRRGAEPRPDPRVSTVPLPTEDGGEVVIQQQNVGADNQVGAGEFKQSDETALHRDPAEAAEAQERLEERAPTGDGRQQT